MNAGLQAFARRSDGADVALVFYAGHGMEVDRVNYLFPVDAQPERDTDVEYVAIPLDRVLRATDGAGLRVVVLDACRNNPWARSMRRTRAVRNVSRGSFGELDEQQFDDETLVAYAAAAGTEADDGEGRNSPYTRALLAHLEEPLEIGMLFRRVRQEVLAATGGRQRPHEYQSLLRAHYLSAAAPPPEEEAFWGIRSRHGGPPGTRDLSGALAGRTVHRAGEKPAGESARHAPVDGGREQPESG